MKKRKVTKEIFHDMDIYVEDFNPDLYEITQSTDFSVLTELCDYYYQHLPIDLSAWMRVNYVDNQELYQYVKKSQVDFIQNQLKQFLRGELIEEPKVISSYYIFSNIFNFVKLPIFELNLRCSKIVLQNDFCQWTISVTSKVPLSAYIVGLYFPYMENSSQKINCEKFPLQLKFSSNHDLFEFIINFSQNLK